MMREDLLVRYGTQDIGAYQEVIEKNGYDLPDFFAPDDVIIDIGANIGTFAYACLQRGCGRVLCFEPEQEAFQILELNLGNESRVDLYREAVWKKTGSCNLFVHQNPLFTAMAHTMYPEGGREVPCVSLDVLLAGLEKRGLGRIRLLKIDAEGAEKPILDSVRSLEGVQEIVGEIHYQMAEPGGEVPSDEWLEKTMDRLGFEPPIIKTAYDHRLYISMFNAKSKKFQPVAPSWKRLGRLSVSGMDAKETLPESLNGTRIVMKLIHEKTGKAATVFRTAGGSTTINPRIVARDDQGGLYFCGDHIGHDQLEVLYLVQGE